MTNNIILYIANHIKSKLTELELDWNFRVDTSNFSNHSITMRVIANRNDELYLNMTNNSQLSLGFTIKDSDQVAILDIMDLLEEFLDEIRYKDESIINIYQIKLSHSGITSINEQDCYLGDIQFDVKYIDKKMRT